MPGTQTIQRSWLVRYGTALVAIGAGLLARLALEAWFGPGLPTFITYYPALLAVAVLAGIGPALVTTVGSALVADYFNIPPAGFRIERAVDALAIALFLGMGLFMTLAVEFSRRALRRANTYNRSLLEASLDPLVTIGPDGKITDVNAATEQVTGCARAALIGTDFSDYFTEPAKARVGYQQVFREGLVRDYPLEVRHRDGQLTSVLYNASVYRDEAGRVIGVFAAARDITERKRAEEAVRRFAQDLQRSNQELEHFAYVASHDLQEPLRTIGSFSQLLARRYQGKLDADADEFIGFVVEAAARMQTLINDLLAFSRVGTRGDAFAAVDGAELVQAAQQNLQAAIAESRAVITHDPLPTLMADRTQLTQLFQNLFGNAIKFRRPEQVPRVHVGAARQDGAWQLSVRDNGIGIDPQFFDRIFIIFQRLHGREEYPGTGIGLAVCKKIVERHGGRMWVESVPGTGSTFHFTLPDDRTSYDPTRTAATSH